MAGTAFLGGRHVIARQGSRLNPRMTATAGVGGPDDEIGMVHPDRVEGVRRVATATVVVTGDVARILADGNQVVVTTEAGASYLQVIHANDWQEVVLGVAGLAVVLRQDVSHRSGS